MDNPFARRRDAGGGDDDMERTLLASGSVEMVAMDMEWGARQRIESFFKLFLLF